MIVRLLLTLLRRIFGRRRRHPHESRTFGQPSNIRVDVREDD
jgi:hypothetical protein